MQWLFANDMNFQKPFVNQLYKICLILGTVGWSRDVSFRYRMFFWSYQIGTIVASLVEGTLLFREFAAASPDQVEYVEWILALMVVLLAGISVMVHALFAHLRFDLRKALENIDNDFFVDWSKMETEETPYVGPHQYVDFDRRVNLMLLGVIVPNIIILVVPFADGSIEALDEDPKLHHYSYYISPVPGKRNIDSFRVYALRYVIENSLLHIRTISLATLLSPSVWLFGVHYYNVFVRLANVIRNDTLVTSEQILSLEMRQSTGRSPSSTGLQNVALAEQVMYDQLENRCISYLKIYRKLRRTTIYIQPYVKGFFFAMVFMNITAFVPFTSLVFQPNVSTSFKISHGTTAVSLVWALWACCSVGSKMQTLDEILTNAMYDIPWYYLPTKKQKAFYLLFCEMQQSTLQFKSFGTQFIAMNVFPKIMHFCYTVINLMNSVETSHSQ